MTFPYKKVLVIGATSGIGKALAEKMLASGQSVIAVGRRKENLDSFVQKHGKDRADSYQFDITALNEIPEFVKNVTKSHPDLDCVVLNSGIQRGFDFTQPTKIDLPAVSAEFTTNYLSYIHLTTAFLPFLQAQKSKTGLIYISSSLALVPMVRCPNYCASKAALHHFTMVLRQQLNGSNVKVVEVLPPAVQSKYLSYTDPVNEKKLTLWQAELHDEKHQPDIKNGRSIGMPLNEFTEEAWKGLVAGDDNVPVGMGKMAWKGFEADRQEIFHKMNS